MFINLTRYESTSNYILGTPFLTLDDIKKVDDGDNIIIVFGYRNITPEEGLSNLLMYDTKND